MDFPERPPSSGVAEFEQILGVEFFNGSVVGVVDAIIRHGGLLVVPAAPALVDIQYDAAYRNALLQSDYAIADSGAMVLLWKLIHHAKPTRISGLAYLQELLLRPELQSLHATFLVLPNESSRTKSLAYLQQRNFQIDEGDCYIAPLYALGSPQKLQSFEDHALLDLVQSRRPAHIIIGVGGGIQEKLGLFLRNTCGYRPAIHCIGAALGFLTGDQKPIPPWIDRFYLGWLLRLARDPSRYARRFWAAHKLPGLIAKYGRQVPPLIGDSEG